MQNLTPITDNAQASRTPDTAPTARLSSISSRFPPRTLRAAFRRRDARPGHLAGSRRLSNSTAANATQPSRARPSRCKCALRPTGHARAIWCCAERREGATR